MNSLRLFRFICNQPQYLHHSGIPSVAISSKGELPFSHLFGNKVIRNRKIIQSEEKEVGNEGEELQKLILLEDVLLAGMV